MLMQPSRGLYLYLETLKVALEDDRISLDEASMLSIISRSLNIPAHTAPDCLAIARGEMKDPISADDAEDWSSRTPGDATLYQTALIAALDDDEITTDEMAILEILRDMMAMQSDEHALIEEAIRSTATEDEQGRRRLERLEQFISHNPWA